MRMVRLLQVCGLSLHSFLDEGGFTNVSKAQQERITSAARQVFPADFTLEFNIEPNPRPKYWSYEARCNGDIFAHGIAIVIIPLEKPVERVWTTNFDNDDESRRSDEHRAPMKRKLDEQSWSMASVRKALRCVNA